MFLENQSCELQLFASSGSLSMGLGSKPAKHRIGANETNRHCVSDVASSGEGIN